MRIGRYLIALWVGTANIALAADATYVPDPSCPLTRWGKDVTLDSIARNMEAASKALRAECPEAADAGDEIERFRKEHEAELKATSDRAKTDVPGFRKVVLDCGNFERVLGDEYREVIRRLQKKLPAPPGEEYKACFDPKIPLAEATSNADLRFKALKRNWTFDCERMRRENAVQVHATVNDVVVQQLVGLARLFVDSASECLNQKKGLAAAETVVSSAVQVAALAATLEPTAAAAIRGVRASSELLKLTFEKLRNHMKPPSGNDPAADRKRRENGCLVITASSLIFGCRPAEESAPKAAPTPPALTGFMISFVPKLEELDSALTALQTQPIDDLIASKASPHPLDRLNNALDAQVSVSVTGQPKPQTVTLRRYLTQVSATLATRPIGPKDRAAQTLLALDAKRLNDLLTAVDQWIQAPLETSVQKQREVILRARGADPSKTDASPEVPLDQISKAKELVRPTELILRHWSASGLKAPVEAYQKWRIGNPGVSVTAAASAPQSKIPSPIRIDEAAAPLNLAYTELIRDFKPNLQEWIAAATTNARGTGGTALPSPQGPIKTGIHALSGLTGRNTASGPTGEPTPDEVRTLSEKFDASVFPLVQLCTYLAPAALLGGDLQQGKHSAFHFEPKNRRFGNRNSTTETYQQACKTLACNGRGLPIFDRKQAASDAMSPALDASEISRFKKTYCSALDTISSDATKTKETYMCFRSPCAPPPGDPAWNFGCAAAWRKKYGDR